MLFSWLDKIIDKKVGKTFALLRKVGRRTERTYYTAYKDWLAYVSRRSHDVTIKITMVTLTVCIFYTLSGTKKLFRGVFEDGSNKNSDMELMLQRYNKTGTIFGLKNDLVPVKLISQKDSAILSEFISQRDK